MVSVCKYSYECGDLLSNFGEIALIGFWAVFLYQIWEWKEMRHKI